VKYENTERADLWTVKLTSADLRLARACFTWLGRLQRDPDLALRLAQLEQRFDRRRLMAGPGADRAAPYEKGQSDRAAGLPAAEMAGGRSGSGQTESERAQS
jgi:hypothetical protein